MLVVILMTALVATASALTLQQTSYDAPWHRECPQGHSISRLESWHNNFYEDRIWTITCLANGKIGTKERWSGSWTTYDHPFRHQCGGSEVLAGMKSVHSNWYEDRRWQFMCRPISVPLINCRWNSFWVNDWDAPLDYSVPSNFVLSGVYSVHDNWRDDRRWKFRVCQLRN